jgi:hypothetical protein
MEKYRIRDKHPGSATLIIPPPPPSQMDLEEAECALLGCPLHGFGEDARDAAHKSHRQVTHIHCHAAHQVALFPKKCASARARSVLANSWQEFSAARNGKIWPLQKKNFKSW